MEVSWVFEVNAYIIAQSMRCPFESTLAPTGWGRVLGWLGGTRARLGRSRI